MAPSCGGPETALSEPVKAPEDDGWHQGARSALKSHHSRGHSPRLSACTRIATTPSAARPAETRAPDNQATRIRLLSRRGTMMGPAHVAMTSKVGYHRIITIGGEGETPCVEVRSELDSAVALFRSLADPTRLAIVRWLAQGEARGQPG